MKEFLLGLDIGTTTISWSVLEKSSFKQIEASNKPNDSFVGTAVQNPERILSICLEIVDEVKKRFERVDAIGVTGQMHGIVILDKGGNSISPLYTWQYPTDSELCRKIAKVSGKNAYSGYGLVTLYGLMSQNRIPVESASFCSIMDYVAMKLCGNTRPVVHTSVASCFGLFDLESNSFDIDSCKKLGIGCSLLPEVTEKSITIGKNGGSLVFIPIGDNQASFLGAVADDDTTLCINCGTGSQVSVAVKDWHGYKCQEVRPFIDGKFLLTGSALCGGRAYTMLEKFFRKFVVAAGMKNEAVYDVMNELVNNSEDCGLFVDCRFCGTRDEPEIKGSVLGITESNFTPDNLIRGFLEGMAQELFDFYKDMNLSGISHIVGSGNAIKKIPAFVKILSEKFGMSIEVSNVREEAAYGACLFAGRPC